LRIALHAPRPHFLEPGFSGDHFILPGIRSGLAERGHEVEVVSYLDARAAGQGDIPARRIVREAVRVRDRMRRFRPDAWLVYGPSVTYPDLFGWWQRPRRYVLFGADQGRPERLPRRLRPFFSAAHRRSLLTADAVGVFRPRSATRLEAMGVAREQIVVLPPMVAMPTATMSQEEARRSLGLPLDVPVVVCVSRFRGAKGDGRPGKTEGVLELLRSMAELPHNVACLIVGDGERRPDVEAERARLALLERVRLAGAVPNSDIHTYYAASDVFAYPYTLDRPWLSALEAQASGRPVVTMRTASAETTVEHGRTGLLAGNVDEFRAQLADLLRDRERCMSMGETARDYVARHHSLDVRIRQVEALLEGGERGSAPQGDVRDA
jgi:glycosyltransferase involved in cell wall biosynthesis